MDISDFGVVSSGMTFTGSYWLTIPSGPALVQLRELCASGEVRAVIPDKDRMDEEPDLIPPSRWHTEDVDVSGWHGHTIGICEEDLFYWLDRQPAQSASAAGGKQCLALSGYSRRCFRAVFQVVQIALGSR
jgi:hypothetical protein